MGSGVLRGNKVEVGNKIVLILELRVLCALTTPRGHQRREGELRGVSYGTVWAVVRQPRVA